MRYDAITPNKRTYTQRLCMVHRYKRIRSTLHLHTIDCVTLTALLRSKCHQTKCKMINLMLNTMCTHTQSSHIVSFRPEIIWYRKFRCSKYCNCTLLSSQNGIKCLSNTICRSVLSKIISIIERHRNG